MTTTRLAGPSGASYSDGVEVRGGGTWVYVSGQLPLTSDGVSSSGDLGAQAELCFNHIERVLGRAGASLANVVRLTAYLTTLEDYAAYAEARRRRFADGFPASTAVQVAGLLGGALVEVDAVAFIPAPDAAQ